MRAAVLVALKTMGLAVCALMAFQGRPPVIAQTVQDAEINALNQHLAHTDGQIDADEKRLRDIELQVSEAQGEARMAFIILGLITSGSLILQIKKVEREAKA